MNSSDKFSDRISDNIPYHLRGSVVHIKGTISSVRRNNPFHNSEQKARQYMYVLSPVNIAGIEFDHTWIYGTKALISLKEGDKIEFTAKLGTYIHNNQEKWIPRFPYRNIKIIRDG